MKAFIFAAGLGTRLKPLTDTMPKALVRINGKPLIDYLIDKLLKIPCSEIIINIHHFPEQIKQHIKQRNLNIPVKFSDESDLLRETGGAIKHAAQLLDGEEPFLVHNSDVITNVDILEMRKAFKDDTIALLLVSKRETSRYLLFDENNRLVAWINTLTGEVKSPYETVNLENCRKLAFAGVHIISPSILKLMDTFPDKFSIIDFYLSIADKFPIMAYEVDNLQMVDVGKYDKLESITNYINNEML